MTCPACGKPSDADWPVEVNGEIVDGGCQACWEAQCWDEHRLPASPAEHHGGKRD